MRPPSTNIDFLILTGPLGSGKTTLLEQLFEHHQVGSGTAVIVNEAGAVNIDGAVLVESANGLIVQTLSNGCVCCSLGNDLVSTVRELLEARAMEDRPPFERIILECSGLSLPGEVMRSLAGLAELQMSVSIICTYDCSRPLKDEYQFDSMIAQLSAAQSVVMTKIDCASEDALENARQVIRQINPFAAIIEETSLSIRSQKAFMDSTCRALDTTLPQPRLTLAVAHPRVRIHHARLAEADPEEVIDWLENITGYLGEKLLRSKTLISTPTRDLLMQTVGTAFSAPKALSKKSDSASVAIFITQDCPVETLKDVPVSFGVEWV